MNTLMATAPLSYRLGRRLTEYARLARLDRPIGIWLLLWPVLWALWISSGGRPAPRVLIVFVFGVFAMRAAGCVINDLVDRDIDPRIRRTRQRPLAARRVTPFEAIVLFVLLSAAALGLVLQLDAFTLRLALVGGVLTMSYPFVKRFFPLKQLRTIEHHIGWHRGWTFHSCDVYKSFYLVTPCFMLLLLSKSSRDSSLKVFCFFVVS